MPSRNRAVRATVALLLAFAISALGDREAAIDATHAAPRLVALGNFVSSFGTSAYMFVFSALIAALAIAAQKRGILTWRGNSVRLVAERALYFFAVIAVSGILAQIIKHVVGRSRPTLLASDGPFHFHLFSEANRLASFPSGHTTSAFAAAVGIGLMAPRWRSPLLVCALLIGLSRILVGAHFPSDVVGGASLGSLVALVLARSFARRGIAFADRGGRIAAIALRAPTAVPDLRG